MAKLKIKQIEDLSLANGVITMGKTAEGGLNTIVPVTGVQEDENASGYISGLSVVGNNLVIERTALPAADTFGTGLLTSPEGATEGRTITLNDTYVKGLFSVDPASGDGYISGLTYEGGVFKPVYKAMPTIGNGILTITAGDTTKTFSANQGTNESITLAKVADTGAAADVVVTSAGNLASTNVQAALQELQGDIDALQAIDPVETTVAAGTGIKVKKTATTEGGNDWTYTVSQDIKLNLADNILQILPNEGDTTPIATVDLSKFAIDGFLDTASYDPTAKDLTLTFNTAAEESGKTDIVVPLDDLVDTYTADDVYIKVADNKFSHVEKTSLPETAQGISAAVTLDVTHKTGTFNVPTVTVDKAGHVSVLGQQQVSITLPDAPATTTKKVYTPAEKQNATGIFTVESGACHFRMYMNGQLLDSTAYTISGNTVTYVPGNYVALEGTDRMDLVYFIEEEITVFNTTPQA